MHPIHRQKTSSYGILKLDEENLVTDFVEKPQSEDALIGFESETHPEKPYLASMGIYIFNINTLNKILQNHAGWLWGKGLYTKSMECLVQARPENDKRDKKGRKNIVRGKNGQFLKGGKHDRSD